MNTDPTLKPDIAALKKRLAEDPGFAAQVTGDRPPTPGCHTPEGCRDSVTGEKLYGGSRQRPVSRMSKRLRATCATVRKRSRWRPCASTTPAGTPGSRGLACRREMLASCAEGRRSTRTRIRRCMPRSQTIATPCSAATRNSRERTLTLQFSCGDWRSHYAQRSRITQRSVTPRWIICGESATLAGC
jgi:hypothetical protein